ncbi:MAG TPA: hypothetical protein H9920_04880 [Candidatus Alistipes faecavium]|nr:hypothetical protein [Candidatus Alistipes faecavium]
MKRDTTGKWWILVVAAGFFAAGVIAVSLERGPLRSALLTVAFAGLLAVALRQTVRRMREREDEHRDNEPRK